MSAVTPPGSPPPNGNNGSPHTPDRAEFGTASINRKKASPISSITKNSWNQLRLKFSKHSDPMASSSSSSYAPQFYLISADKPHRESRTLDAKRPDEPNRAGDLGPPLEFSSDTRANDSFAQELRHDEEDGSDAATTYSFDKVASLRYYKPIETAYNSRTSSVHSWQSDFLSDSEELVDDFSDYDNDNDFFSELLAEVNELPTDYDEGDTTPTVERTKSSGSMHRQLSQKVTREDSVVTFFNETTPKRTRSHHSTTSSVFPILE